MVPEELDAGAALCVTTGGFGRIPSTSFNQPAGGAKVLHSASFLPSPCPEFNLNLIQSCHKQDTISEIFFSPFVEDIL